MEIRIEKDVLVRMRDGVELVTDVYRPAGEGRFPTLVQRTPYGRDLPALANSSFDLLRGAQAGYAIVNQDTRGRWGSQGAFSPFVDEGRDGADTIAWASSRPWCSDRVGMIGASYYGATQWRAATEQPDALVALAPFITSSNYYEGWTYQGGAFQLGFVLNWTLRYLVFGEVARRMRTGDAGKEELDALARAIDAGPKLYRRTPLTDVPELDDLAPFYREWLAHPRYDSYWRATAPDEQYGRIMAPALNMGGWYDLFQKGTLANYRGMRERGGSEGARRAQLVMGPWAHGVYGDSYAERSFGFRAGAAVYDLTGHQLRWFDHHLRGVDNGVDREKPVKLFVMGADVWREEDDWPLGDTRWERWYLHSRGRANTVDGNGLLSRKPPGNQRPDVYLYDPSYPVPTCGGATLLPGLSGAMAGPRDQQLIEQRIDVLVYTSEPLPTALEVIGPIELVLFASSSAVDTDFTGKLVDVEPQGRAEILTDGILRARYRESLSEAKPLERDHITELHLDLCSTANVFRAGHRIRLEVSSSNFPRFDRNTNTGGTIAEESEADFIPAVNCVHHGGDHPSHLILPVIERS